MTDLAALAAELFPGAEVVRQGRSRSRSIAWVRVMRARVPAFDALEPGDLVVVPASVLAAVAPSDHDVDELAARLAAVPVSGCVLVEAEAGADSTEALRAATPTFARARIPTIRLGRTDVGALERSIVGFIVGRGAELERQAALLEAELRRRAIDGAGVEALLGAVSSFLGRAVALWSGPGRPNVVHAPADVPGAAADAARYEANPGEQGDRVALRVELPSATRSGTALLLLGAEPASELARIAAPRVASLLALELARDEAIGRAADRTRGPEPMPSDGPPWVVILARQGGAASGGAREAASGAAREAASGGAREDLVTGAATAEREAREADRRAIRLLAPARRLALRGDANSLEVRLIAAGQPEAITALAERVADLLGRVVAVSRPFQAVAERPAAEAEARATLDAALALAAPPRVAVAERRPMYLLLAAVHRLPDGPAIARAVLAPLLDARSDVRRERFETLRALLAHGGIGEAAAALGVHRNTVAYRVRRIEAATGWRLADPELRLPLAVALALIPTPPD